MDGHIGGDGSPGRSMTKPMAEQPSLCLEDAKMEQLELVKVIREANATSRGSG
jgi:hypothetical protein